MRDCVKGHGDGKIQRVIMYLSVLYQCYYTSASSCVLVAFNTVSISDETRYCGGIMGITFSLPAASLICR